MTLIDDSQYPVLTSLINKTQDLYDKSLNLSVENATAEVIEARKGKETLGEQIDNINSQLNDKLSNTDYVRGEGYATDTGIANAYVITLNPAPTAYVAGQSFKFKATNANTGTSTLNVNGLGAKTIKKNSNVNLVAGNILAGQIVTAVYDGSNFQIREDISSALADMTN
jgi:hypothetical protein